jgi:hypothetical protein
MRVLALGLPLALFAAGLAAANAMHFGDALEIATATVCALLGGALALVLISR